MSYRVPCLIAFIWGNKENAPKGTISVFKLNLYIMVFNFIKLNDFNYKHAYNNADMLLITKQQYNRQPTKYAVKNTTSKLLQKIHVHINYCWFSFSFIKNSEQTNRQVQKYTIKYTDFNSNLIYNALLHILYKNSQKHFKNSKKTPVGAVM